MILNFTSEHIQQQMQQRIHVEQQQVIEIEGSHSGMILL